MFMIEYRSTSWWCWLATVCLLTIGVSGWAAAFFFTIGLTVVQVFHFVVRERSLTAFPVQVRLAYLLLLLIALPANLRWAYWLPMLGTWVQVLFGYCTMARMVSLLPWNRTEAFSIALLKRTFLSAPIRGNILHGFTPAR